MLSVDIIKYSSEDILEKIIEIGYSIVKDKNPEEDADKLINAINIISEMDWDEDVPKLIKELSKNNISCLINSIPEDPHMFSIWKSKSSEGELEVFVGNGFAECGSVSGEFAAYKVTSEKNDALDKLFEKIWDVAKLNFDAFDTYSFPSDGRKFLDNSGVEFTEEEKELFVWYLKYADTLINDVMEAGTDKYNIVISTWI